VGYQLLFGEGVGGSRELLCAEGVAFLTYSGSTPFIADYKYVFYLYLCFLKNSRVHEKLQDFIEMYTERVGIFRGARSEACWSVLFRE
jgi:hypothetical protein